VFYLAMAFNSDLSKWQVGKVTNMLNSTYTLPHPLQDRVFSRLFLYSIFFLWHSTNSIFEHCSLLFFFSTHFYPWTFLCCCCGAVFYKAYAFNGDLSTWQVGKVTTMQASTYTLSPPLPLQGRVVFQAASISLLLSVAALILCLNNALSSFFRPIFILGLFFVVVQCFTTLMPSTVISPPGMLVL
jgi:surface protein